MAIKHLSPRSTSEINQAVEDALNSLNGKERLIHYLQRLLENDLNLINNTKGEEIYKTLLKINATTENFSSLSKHFNNNSYSKYWIKIGLTDNYFTDPFFLIGTQKSFVFPTNETALGYDYFMAIKKMVIRCKRRIPGDKKDLSNIAWVAGYNWFISEYCFAVVGLITDIMEIVDEKPTFPIE